MTQLMSLSVVLFGVNDISLFEIENIFKTLKKMKILKVVKICTSFKKEEEMEVQVEEETPKPRRTRARKVTVEYLQIEAERKKRVATELRKRSEKMIEQEAKQRELFEKLLLGVLQLDVFQCELFGKKKKPWETMLDFVTRVGEYLVNSEHN